MTVGGLKIDTVAEYGNDSVDTRAPSVLCMWDGGVLDALMHSDRDLSDFVSGGILWQGVVAARWPDAIQ